jgi:hypothetical protein
VTQRDRLFEVATRWFADRPEPDDGRFVTQLFIYESVIWAPTIRGFVADILWRTRPGPLHLRRLRSKDELRKALASACGGLNERARELFEQFRRYPDEFFPGTPADLVLAAREDGWPLGMVRIKRERRIAEKASRRIADCLADRIRGVARELAEGRAAAAGVPLDLLFSSPEAMLDDFARAERIVSRAFRDETPTFEPPDLRVDDVIGVKFVGSPPELEEIERAVVGHPLVAGVEREEHHGRYNDVNLLVDLTLPPPGEIIEAARGRDWSFAAGRGLTPEALAREFPGYVESGARTVRAEVILTTCEELIESEFGRSIHEQRILEQRRSVPYSGRIASNASFLVEYLLMLAISPTAEVAALPVKMWGQYLPDIYSLAVWRLFGIRPGLDAVNAFTDPMDAFPVRSAPPGQAQFVRDAVLGADETTREFAPPLAGEG